MADVVDLTKPKQRGGFKPGKSGNPSGRPPGSRSKATLIAQSLLDGQRVRNLSGRPSLWLWEGTLRP